MTEDSNQSRLGLDEFHSHLVHPDKIDLARDNHPVARPIHQSTKFRFESYEQLKTLMAGNREGFLYSRVRNPTVAELEQLLAKLQGCETCICLGSGVAALTHPMLQILRSGDHVVGFYESYKPIRFFLRETLAKFGVSHSLVRMQDLDALEDVFATKNPRMLVFESPSNPLLSIADIPAVLQLCRKYRVFSLFDNTFAGFHNHSQYSFDLIVHSLSKYASGSGDALGGAILGTKKLLNRLRLQLADLGAPLDPFAAARIMANMETYLLRYRRQCESAYEIARWMEGQTCFTRVVYPGLESHPQHDLAKEQARDFGTVIFAELDGGEPALAKFLDGLKLFQVTGSLGATKSLAAPCNLFYGADLSEKEIAFLGLGPATFRLSIGLESTKDIKADIERAIGH